MSSDLATSDSRLNMKQFPYKFESTKEVLFYPKKPDFFEGDILEIGPGQGDLLLELAKQSPEEKFVAIELGNKRFNKLIPRLQKRETNNVLLIKGDVRLILPQYFDGGSFKKIFILFPDPWPKKRHAFRRLLDLKFLWLLTHHLKKNGELILGTDVKGYALWTIDNLCQIPSLANSLAPLPFTSSISELPKTFFEEKWRKEGREVFFLKYKKTDV